MPRNIFAGGIGRADVISKVCVQKMRHNCEMFGKWFLPVSLMFKSHFWREGDVCLDMFGCVIVFNAYIDPLTALFYEDTYIRVTHVIVTCWRRQKSLQRERRIGSIIERSRKMYDIEHIW